jgi:hypothetical protein
MPCSEMKFTPCCTISRAQEAVIDVVHTTTRCTCDLEPNEKSAQSSEDSSLVSDFIKLVAATGTATASTAAPERGNQKLTDVSDDCMRSNESQQEYQGKGEKYGWLQHCISTVQQNIPSPVAFTLPAVHSESDRDNDSPTRQESMPDSDSDSLVSYGQMQKKMFDRTTSMRRGSTGLPPLQDPVGIYCPSASVDRTGSAKLLLQDLECGQSGRDLVKVRVAHLARHDLWTGAHHNSWSLNSCSRPQYEKPLVRAWSGSLRNSGWLADHPLAGSHHHHPSHVASPKTGQMGGAARQYKLEEVPDNLSS